MDVDNGKTCPSCGKALKEGAAFCTNCGAATGAVSPAPPGAESPPGGQETTQPLTPPAPAAPVPPGPPAAGVEGGGMPAAEYAPAPPPRKNRTALVIGVIGGLLIAGGIVVLLLGFVVGPKWFAGKAGGTGDPISLAEKYIGALEDGDVDAYFDCFKEEFLEDNPIMEGMGMDMRELMEMTFKMMEVKFDDYALEVESERGSEATVVSTSGKVTMSVMGLEEKIDLAEDPMVFEMVKEGGRWYLTQDPMPTTSMGGDMDFDGEDLEFDFENMEDFNFEDMEEFLPENMEDFDLEDLEEFLPEELNLEDLENMSPEDLERMLEELEKMFEDMPVEGESST